MSAAFRAERTVSAKGYGLGEKRLKYQPILSDFAIFNRESILLSVVPAGRDIFFPNRDGSRTEAPGAAPGRLETL